MEKYDLVVIGSGPGGYVSAIRAAQLGMSVAVIERDKPGGVCLNWGCIPSKSILKCAELYETLQSAGDYGIILDNLSYDYTAVIAKSRKAADTLSKGVSFLLKKNKIDFIPGTASFVKPDVIGITGVKHEKEIMAAHSIIATGSFPTSIPGLDIDGAGIMSSDQAIISPEVPASIAVIGGGAVGVEFAYIYGSFGTKVHVIEMEGQLLPGMDSEVATELAKQLKRKGIDVHTSSLCKGVEKKEGGYSVMVERKGGGEPLVLEVEKVLVAVGRRPLVEPLALGNAGVALGENGFIQVDRSSYETTASGVYAIGDVIGPPLLAHKASEEGVAAVEMMSGMTTGPPDYSNIPSCVYCQPEVATLGMSEEECTSLGLKVDIGRYPFKATGKAVATGDTRGFVKLIVDSGTGEILGAHIIGHGATELIAEIGLGRALETTPFEIAEAPHAHPTLSEAIMEAALGAMGRARHI